jgi:predicted transposase YbfD/YdcC
MSTLWSALESLPDRRTKKGRRYSLSSIVTLSLAAMLSGANDLRAIFRWGRRLTPKSLEMLGIDRGRAPCHATYHYVFQSIAAEDLERALRGLVPAGALGHIALDGKRLRGSQHETSPGVHMLHAFATGLQMTVGSLAVPPDSGEVTEALKLLKDLPLDGAIVTGDAAFTFAPLCAAIRDRGGHYFFFVKGNQPELQAELAHAFGDDSPLETGQLSRSRHSANRSARSRAP